MSNEAVPIMSVSLAREIVRGLDSSGMKRFRTLRRACLDVARMLARSAEEQTDQARGVWVEEAMAWGRSAIAQSPRLESDDVSTLLRGRLERATRAIAEGDITLARQALILEVPSAERLLGRIDMPEVVIRGGEVVVFGFCPDEDLGRVRRLLLPIEIASSLRCCRLQFGIHWLRAWPELEEANHEIPGEAFATIVFDEPALEHRQISLELRNTSGGDLLLQPILSLEIP